MKEIERKFLVKGISFNDLNIQGTQLIEQFYIGVNPEIRVRRIGEEDILLTIKSVGDLVRDEVNLPVPKNKYRELEKVRVTPHIIKTRYLVEISKQGKESTIAHLDMYKVPKGLKTVEVEFQTEEEALEFIPLEWFGEEVTKKREYKNKIIAVMLKHNNLIIDKKTGGIKLI